MKRVFIYSSECVSPRGICSEMITRFIDFNLDDSRDRITSTYKYNDLCILNGIDNIHSVYYTIFNAVNRGWTGLCLYIHISEYTDVNFTVLKQLEDGIIIIKDKPALVWNSLNIFVFVSNPKECYDIAENNYERKLSPRITQLEVEMNI